MADVTVVKITTPNETQNVSIRATAGGTVPAGDCVYLDGTSGWKAGDADAAASGQVRGIAVPTMGDSEFASGQEFDLVTYGPVGGYSGLTPGGGVFVSLNAGKLTQTAPPNSGDFIFAIGWAMSASVIFVQPQITVPGANAS
jgi:hypothetical protein